MKNLIKNDIKTKKITSTEIYKTVVNVVVYEFNISEYYKNSFVYKIYCKLANSYLRIPKKHIAIDGGFRGINHEASVDRAINKYNEYYQNNKLFKEIAEACKNRLDDSNNVLESYREKLIDEIVGQCNNSTDDKLQEVLSIIQEKL